MCDIRQVVILFATKMNTTSSVLSKSYVSPADIGSTGGAGARLLDFPPSTRLAVVPVTQEEECPPFHSCQTGSWNWPHHLGGRGGNWDSAFNTRQCSLVTQSGPPCGELYTHAPGSPMGRHLHCTDEKTERPAQVLLELARGSSAAGKPVCLL